MEKRTEVEIQEIYQKMLLEIREELEKYEDAEGMLKDYQKTRVGELASIEDEVSRIIEENYPEVGEKIQGFGKRIYEETYMYPYKKVLKDYGKSLVAPTLVSGVIERVVDQPVAGMALSQRLYRERERLAKKASVEIAIGKAQGKSSDQIAMGISKDAGISYRNAIRITRTEGTRIAGKATHDSTTDINTLGKDFGVGAKKKWISAKDSRVRASHSSLHGTYADMDGYFTSSSGARTLHPSGFGIAEEDINCRCAIVNAITINGKEIS